MLAKENSKNAAGKANFCRLLSVAVFTGKLEISHRRPSGSD
ncbi:MAG: hypothetical protein ACLSWV_07935 [Pygmaiobacter massiliensis]